MLYQSVHFPFEKWTRGIAYILVICISLEGKASHGKSLLPARGKFDNLCDFCDKSYEYISLSLTFSLPLSSSPGNRDLPNSLRRSPRFVAREIFHTKEQQPFLLINIRRVHSALISDNACPITYVSRRKCCCEL